MPDWLAILKAYVDTLETIVGTEGGVSLADKLTAARALLLDQITAARMAELDAGNVPADVDTLKAAVGAIEGATALHNKLTAARAVLLDQITALRMAELDAANLPADIDLIKGYTDTLEGAIGAIEGATTLHNKLTAARALLLDQITALRMAELDAANIPADTDPKVMGRLQIKATTIDLNQIAGTYDLFTATTQDVVVEKLVLRCPAAAAGGALTSISIQTDDATAQVFISSVQGAVANLTSEAQLAWTGAVLLDAGTSAKIRLTIAGGATGVAYVCDAVAECRAVVAGGYLA